VLLLPGAVAATTWNGELVWYAEALRSKWWQQPPARSSARQDQCLQGATKRQEYRVHLIHYTGYQHYNKRAPL